MIITMVPKEEASNVWHDIEPLLAAAWDYAPGLYQPIDIFADIMTDKQKLWVIADEDKNIIGCFTTVLNQYPLTRRMCISCLAGSRLEDWYEEALEIVKRYARDFECSKLECKARKGFRDYAKKTGWTEAAIVYEMPLEVEE